MDTNARFQIFHLTEVCISVVALRSQTVDAEPMQHYVAAPSWIGLHSAKEPLYSWRVGGFNPSQAY